MLFWEGRVLVGWEVWGWTNGGVCEGKVFESFLWEGE